ncbi:conjugative transposon protein TraM [Maribacter litoralis]|uniref:conjugative transposon protein TraM n=1 Tax=Maribacter litoralis TaxID=2059726 RepID=UPI003F5CEF1F
MKIEKNKLLFGGIIIAVVLFIAGYSLFLLEDREASDTELKQTQVPELEDEQKAYSSKLDAVNSVKEKRESNAPSVYDVTLLDSTGLYDPNLKEKERQRIVDSIYRHGRIDYSKGTYRQAIATVDSPSYGSEIVTQKMVKIKMETIPIDFTTAHSAFFNSMPVGNKETKSTLTDIVIPVAVNGQQTVKTNSRLELRLTNDALINDVLVPRNSLLFGFVSFKANRALINITNIDHRPVELKAFDLLDGNEGIYIENSFRAEASREVLDDIVQDINIAGVPQIGGIKQVFRRNNRNVKVTIHNQYRLLLKSTL